jgi:hypothetical protein
MKLEINSKIGQISTELNSDPTAPNRPNDEEHFAEACQVKFPSEVHPEDNDFEFRNEELKPNIPITVLASASLHVKNISCPVNEHRNFQKVAVGQTKIMKQFKLFDDSDDSLWYSGTVSCFDPSNSSNLYEIQYEDGDSEVLTKNRMLQLKVLTSPERKMSPPKIAPRNKKKQTLT